MSVSYTHLDVYKRQRLWWPNGYGDPNLYHCKFEVMVDGKVSETKDVSFGIKKDVYKRQELCKEIKADIDLCHIPVIFLTAKNDLESKINGLDVYKRQVVFRLPETKGKSLEEIEKELVK